MAQEKRRELIGVGFYKTIHLTDEQAENIRQIIADALNLNANDVDIELDEE